MLKALRLLAVVGILGVSVWASAPGLAQASVTCEDLQLTPCTPGTIYCTFSSGQAGACNCHSGKRFCFPLLPPG